ncbi:gamma-glutamyltransferase [Nocardioides sp. REDSEA-S30_B4]|uniref:gamma-glutamyltransferase n=1 Tax=Nocardioides sp. REDSEA-S30_B4 TaxID=1811552 RepID=UPI0025CE5759|nr:gamma-glutamyltransferase [Nocardioides sp. REDSEA-S30_B4]
MVAQDSGVDLASGGEEVGKAYGRKLRPLLSSLSLKGSLGETTRIPTAGVINAPMLVLVGLGATPSTAALRRAAGAAARAVPNAASVALALPTPGAAEVRAVTEGWLLGGYRFTTYQRDTASEATGPGEVVVLSPGARKQEVVTALEQAQVVADAVSGCRDWVNTPPGDLTPPLFADAVVAAAAPLTEAIHRDTIYITVVDRDRMAVSLIYSIFHGFGSGIASDKFGILFQNRGAGFTLTEGHPNEMKGGKRPMHTIIPGMLRENGRVTTPFGVMGGAYQPNGHARFVTNLTDFGMDMQSAMDAPRSFSDNGTMNVEKGYSDAVRQELADMGHKVAVPSDPLGGSQAIRIREDGVLEGASDPRKDGCAIGY